RAPGRIACTPRSARLLRGNSRRRKARRRSWPSVGGRGLQGVEPALDLGELFPAPRGVLLEDRRGGPDDAIRVASVFGGLERAIQLPIRRQAPAGASDAPPVRLQDPRAFALREPVEERRQIVARRHDLRVIPVDEPRGEAPGGYH